MIESIFISIIANILTVSVTEFVGSIKNGINRQAIFEKVKANTNNILPISLNEFWEICTPQTIPGSDFSFYDILKQQLADFLSENNFNKSEVKTYTDQITETALEIIQYEDPILYSQIISQKSYEHITQIGRQLDSLLNPLNPKHILSIAKIESELQKDTINPQLNLDFFNIDDEEFKANFKNSLTKEKIVVVGKSKEESIYCLLNELRKLSKEKEVIIIKNEATWQALDENSSVQNCYLIPWFYADNIRAISDNTNIFIFNEDESCGFTTSLKLRRRLKQNIVNALIEAGLEYEAAYKLVTDTKGLYLPMKKRIYNGASLNKPSWAKDNNKGIIAALLCGKWADCEGDKLILEELASTDYDNISSALNQYAKHEEPLIINSHSLTSTFMQLADVETAWEYLADYIDQSILDKFSKLVHYILSDIEPLFDYPLAEHFMASLKAAKPDFSHHLKTGVLRTLTMLSCYKNKDYYVDELVKDILSKVNSLKSWAYISQYFKELCEASPEMVMSKLEQELINPQGLIELFQSNDGDLFTSRNYYTNIIFGVEQLLLQKEYVSRAIDWLLTINEKNIDYKMQNSPQNTLEVVFCAWQNSCALDPEQKMQLAQAIIRKYSKAWFLIAKQLPTRRSTISGVLARPHYRSIEDFPKLTTAELQQTFRHYLRICLDNVNGNIERWLKILEIIDVWDKDIISNTFRSMDEDWPKMNDEDRIKLKTTLREEIYRNRFFQSSDWAMGKEKTDLYEQAFNQISTVNPLYEYLYLFTPSYNFPLLHPEPYKEDKTIDYDAINTQKIRTEITAKIGDFAANGLSIIDLLKLCTDNYDTAGTIVGKYYCGQETAPELLRAMLDASIAKRAIVEFVRQSVIGERLSLKQAVCIAREKQVNDDLLIDLLQLEEIAADKTLLIDQQAEHIQKQFWKAGNLLYILKKRDRDSLLLGLAKFQQYDNKIATLDLLGQKAEYFSALEIYNFFTAIFTKRNQTHPGPGTKYNTEKVLDILYSEYRNDYSKGCELAKIEIYLNRLLDWENMKFTKIIMQAKPNLYAELIAIIFKKDDGLDAPDDVKKLADLYTRLFLNIEFCPAEIDGKVDYQQLKNWTEQFKSLLATQNQSRLFSDQLGKLLAYSPPGTDNIMPCEAVRDLIEEIFDENLKSAYEIAERNKRGAYYGTSGQDEHELYLMHKNNADKLRLNYPRTATIFDEIAKSYQLQSEQERGRAVDGW